jgi:hypothetical protein
MTAFVTPARVTALDQRGPHGKKMAARAAWPNWLPESHERLRSGQAPAAKRT